MQRRLVFSFFDASGYMVRPWAEAGYECHIIDMQNDDAYTAWGDKGGSIHKHGGDLSPCYFSFWLDFVREIAGDDPVDMVFGFGPCDDLAVCGAKHFAAKRARNPAFQEQALALWRVPGRIAEALNAPHMSENPRSVISTMYRRFDYRFDPCEYGGYLPQDDTHPDFPQYIAPRDAYTKDTWLWTGNGFVMPDKQRVEPLVIKYDNGVQGSQQFAKLGGKSAKTKYIRSATARGFARATFLANTKIL